MLNDFHFYIDVDAPINEIEQWCKENIEGWHYYEDYPDYNDLRAGRVFGYDFYINDKEDAMAFKLRWL